MLSLFLPGKYAFNSVVGNLLIVLSQFLGELIDAVSLSIK